MSPGRAEAHAEDARSALTRRLARSYLRPDIAPSHRACAVHSRESTSVPSRLSSAAPPLSAEPTGLNPPTPVSGEPYFPPAPSSTPWAPSWAPDGESIAVAMSGSIWRVDPDTGVAEELTYSPDAYHTSPDWSPDGRWIVYAADYDGDRVQLELLEVATGETRALTNDDHAYADPTFSPDGTRISYVSTRPNGYFNVAVRPVEESRWAGDEMPITTDHAYPANRLYSVRGTCT